MNTTTDGTDLSLSSRLLTAAAVLGGFTTLGIGLGELIGQPGAGVILGFGAGVAMLGLIRAIRGG